VDKYEWSTERADEHVGWILFALGGGPAAAHREPASVPNSLDDHEDDHILSLAEAAGASILVTANYVDFDVDQPWRQRIALMRPAHFVGMVSGARMKAGWAGGRPPSVG
jgi:hypothetical protein